MCGSVIARLRRPGLGTRRFFGRRGSSRNGRAWSRGYRGRRQFRLLIALALKQVLEARRVVAGIASLVRVHTKERVEARAVVVDGLVLAVAGEGIAVAITGAQNGNGVAVFIFAAIMIVPAVAGLFRWHRQ